MFLAGIVLVAAVQGAPAARTTQQDYDAATELTVKGDHAAALAAWEAFERRVANNPRTLAIARVRKGGELTALRRPDEAAEALRAGLAGLPSSDATLRVDRYNALFLLAQLAEMGLDYAGAAKSYGEASTTADRPDDAVSALLGVIRTATYVDPSVANEALGRADALAAANKMSDDVLGALEQRRGLLLLNRGDTKAARAALERAVKLFGGMTNKTDLRDVSARSDAAVAALLDGDRDEARRYMAMTGAGRMQGQKFTRGVEMSPPVCGGDLGLKPEDMAVVEFSVSHTGAVVRSAPVYAAGGGDVALEFARAALAWSWTPEQVKELPPFFRANARVEVRCSTALERPSVRRVPADALAEWMIAKGLTPLDPETPDGPSLPAHRAALAATEAKGIAALPALWRLATNVVVAGEERATYARRALALATSAGAPALARLAPDLVLRANEGAGAGSDSKLRNRLQALMSDPGYAADPQARSVLRLVLADTYNPGHRTAQPLLRQVADDGALAANDALKVGALVRLASAAQAEGDAASARAAFARSGLSANQCAIMDSPPKMLGAGGTFPREAAIWGFEGWTLSQFDVSAEGKVVNNRLILSYPPFVFSQAGQATTSGARYAKSYRPDGGLGCGAQTLGVRFSFGQ
jgi:hypothetical protein